MGPDPTILLAPWPTAPETLAAPRFNNSPGNAAPDTGPEEPFSPSPGVYVHVSIPITAVVGLVRHFFRTHPRLRLLHARRVCRDFPPRQAALSCLLLDAAGSLAQSMARGDPEPALQAHVLDPEGLEMRLFAEAAGEIEAWLLADPAERTPLDATEFLAAPLIMHGWAERRGLFDLAKTLEGVCAYVAGVAVASGSTSSWETVMCSALRVRSVDEVRAAPLAPHWVALLRDAWTAYHEFQGCLFALARIEAEAAARDSLSTKRGDPTGLDFLVGHLHTMPPDGTWRLSFQDAFDPRFADHRPSHVAPLLAWIGVAPPRPSLPAQLSTPDVAFLLLARTRLLLDALHAAAASSSSCLPYPDLDDCNESKSGDEMHSSASFTCDVERRRRGLLVSVRSLHALLANEAEECARAVLAGAWMELETPCGEVFIRGRVHAGFIEGLADKVASAEGGGVMLGEILEAIAALRARSIATRRLPGPLHGPALLCISLLHVSLHQRVLVRGGPPDVHATVLRQLAACASLLPTDGGDTVLAWAKVLVSGVLKNVGLGEAAGDGGLRTGEVAALREWLRCM
ncbi:hypothetical protein DFJ74DRAFT_434729 [Hyaloraphidium curvatum]|nr:hypothetical protein DFJ74DRAFT_434729 [Hyaloraphidium curvatum]